ncbi:unnamed protein product [Amoebophrya sp. A25]|nr:unnamed protein product [Amoebophrya sp. A25]|eukprot:GSA25T00012705001.1
MWQQVFSNLDRRSLGIANTINTNIYSTESFFYRPELSCWDGSQQKHGNDGNNTTTALLWIRLKI